MGAGTTKVEHFTVDAAILQELGERLIGQPHIALAEVIKNAYDADAHSCTVTFEDDTIVVCDDGHGMELADFRNHWLRIGTRHKAAQEVSRKLYRRLTGSKGVGRLAVQFLGTKLDLWTTPDSKGAKTVSASVDWDKIRRGSDLSEFDVTVDRDAEAPQYPNGSKSGTRIVISGLKSDWDSESLRLLGRQLWTLRSPFARRRPADVPPSGPDDFDVELTAPGIEDAEEAFDEVRQALTETVWKAKITGRMTKGRAGSAADISIEFRDGYPDGAEAHTYKDSVSLPVKAVLAGEKAYLDDVRFTIFVYRLEQRQAARVPLGDLRDYLERFGNVSVYDAGFRLPYYGADHDWLGIELDHASRISNSELLPSKWNIAERYMLDLPTTRRIFGAVEINTSQEERRAKAAKARPGEWLEIQPGRDRLHPNPAHRQLRDLVRYALDLYANRYQSRLVAAVERHRFAESPSRKQSRVMQLLERHQREIPQPVFEEIRREAQDAQDAVYQVEREIDARASLLAPLAAAGMTALGFTHELARETRSLSRAEKRLRVLARKHDLPDLAETADELGRSLQRLQALQSLFRPLMDKGDREDRERLLVRPVVRQVVDGMKPLVPGLAFDLQIPADLRFPPGPLASWSAVLQNLIANAWNAMLTSTDRRLRIEGHDNGKQQFVWLADTGVGLGVPLSESQRLFDPFERALEISPDQATIAIGGQGLGLSIVRMICARHGVDAAFVEPEAGYATMLQLLWKA